MALPARGGAVDPRSRLSAQHFRTCLVDTARTCSVATPGGSDVVHAPDLDGVEVCRRIRSAQPGAVIVVLTARAEEMDIVVGLEAGADDYLTKPFRFGELLARIRAHLRRSSTLPAAQATVTVGALLVDVAARRVTVAGVEVVLRTKEFDLLARLAADAGAAVSRESLMEDVWDAHWFGSTKTLDVHVASVRRKLTLAAGDVDAQAPVISTLRGHGYRLDLP